MLHGFVAVHFRHHDVHQSDVDTGRILQRLDAIPAVFRIQHLHVVAFEEAGESEDIPHVVVDDEHFLAGENRILLVKLLEHLPFRFRQILFHAVQEERGFIKQAIQRSHVFDDDCLCHASQLGFLFRSQILSSVDDDRNVPDLRLDAVHQFETVHIG